MTNKISIFNYDKYRHFLNDYLQNQPKKGFGEISRWAEALGVHPSLVSQVLNDRKDLSLEQASDLSQHLQFTESETDYFLNLLLKERAGNKILKEFFAKKVKEKKLESQKVVNRVETNKNLSDRERALFYSSWIYSAARLCTSLPDGKTAEGLAQKFNLPRQKMMEILDFLIQSGLIVSSDKGFNMGPQFTHLEYGSPFLSRHHSNWRLKAIQRSENLSEDELMFTSPVTLSREDFKIIRENLLKAIESTMKKVKESPEEDIACINVDWFWVKP